LIKNEQVPSIKPYTIIWFCLHLYTGPIPNSLIVKIQILLHSVGDTEMPTPIPNQQKTWCQRITSIYCLVEDTGICYCLVCVRQVSCHGVPHW